MHIFYLLLLFHGAIADLSVMTNGHGVGDLCDGKWCAKGAVCRNNRCQCLSGVGIGDLFCHAIDTLGGHVHDDPEATTFNNQGVKVDTPCRYFVTHVLTELHAPGGEKGGKCGTKVWSFNKRVRGKWFVSGVDLSVHKIPHHPGGEDAEDIPVPDPLVIRIAGSASYGQYSFQAYVKRTEDYGGWNEVQLPWKFEKGVELTVDSVNNLVIFSDKHCGVNLAFRPADEQLGIHQSMGPGFSISFGEKYQPKWESLEQTVLLGPQPMLPRHVLKTLPPLTIKSVSHVLNMHKNDAFLFKALTGHNVHQDFPSAPESCPVLIHEAKKCATSSRRRQAFNECNFILTSPLFVKCWSGKSIASSENIIQLFANCLSAFCQESVQKCQSVKNQLIGDKCIRHTPRRMRNLDCSATLAPE